MQLVPELAHRFFPCPITHPIQDFGCHLEPFPVYRPAHSGWEIQHTGPHTHYHLQPVGQVGRLFNLPDFAFSLGVYPLSQIGGGTKKGQQKDIKRATDLWQEYKKRRLAESERG
ncbi:MAG: hypothetical protein AB7S77_24200, partial [Desulfatirhabdiaceae bacterium]